MWSNEVTQTIPGSAEEVFAVWTDLERRPTWDDHDEWVQLSAPLAPGVAYRIKTEGAPAATVTVAALEPGRRFVSEGSLPGASLRFSFELEPAGERETRATYRQEIDGAASQLLGFLLGPRIRRDAPITLRRLATEVRRRREAPPAPS